MRRAGETTAAVRAVAAAAKNRGLDLLLDVVYERRLRLCTRTLCLDEDYRHHLAREGLSDHERVGHYASEWLTLRRILDRRDVTPDDGFLDLGCGQGRVLVEAALRYPFGSITGVEISPSIAATARANLARIRTSATIDIVEADAAAYRIPSTVTVIYLFNPFRGTVFDAFVSRLEESLEEDPRRLRIVYRLPREEDRLLATGRFRKTRIGRSLLTGRERDTSLAMFETT